MEALNLSINEFGAVNLPYMLSIYEPDMEAVKEEVREKTGESEVSFSEVLTGELKQAALVYQSCNSFEAAGVEQYERYTK